MNAQKLFVAVDGYFDLAGKYSKVGFPIDKILSEAHQKCIFDHANAIRTQIGMGK